MVHACVVYTPGNRKVSWPKVYIERHQRCEQYGVNFIRTIAESYSEIYGNCSAF